MAMPLFLSESERKAILERRDGGDPVVNRFWTALKTRVARRASSPGLLGPDDDVAWWYPAAEYLSDAAMVYAIEPTETVGSWLRDISLGIARRSTEDWVGPWFRDHATRPPVGHLETAHLCWALATAIDLAPDAFSPEQRREIEQTLAEKGIVLCRHWLDRNTHLANWRSIMVAGVAVAAAAIGDRAGLEYAAGQTLICVQAFQGDGSYAESLQYANYMSYALMMACEAIVRFAPGVACAGPEIYGRSMPWIAQSMLYMKPLAGLDEPRARAVNFNDCGALHRPSGDVILQVAARCRESLPKEAGLARWLFDTYYAPVPTQGPHHLATFGFRNDWGFLTFPFMTRAVPAISPAEAGLPTLSGFSNGNVFVRDAWNGQTVLAIQGGTEALYGPGHLHGDLNSFILAHRKERLLCDPGHSCYRNLIHGLESSSQTHNTCTFLVQQDALGLQEDLAKATLLEQKNVPARRLIADAQVSDPLPPRGRRLLLSSCDGVACVVSEVASQYGSPIEEFTRVWLQADRHTLFVLDRIRAAKPVVTVWNWLLNNRDGASQIEVSGPAEIVLRRGGAGMKMYHFAGGRLNGPVYAYLHDAYHPEPNRPCEGRPGSGMLYRWMEPSAREHRIAAHAFLLDDAGMVHRRTAAFQDGKYVLQGDDATWIVDGAASDGPMELSLRRENDGRVWRLREREGVWSFSNET
jgi:hypothetical protein